MPRLLIVDDCPELLAAYRRILKSEWSIELAINPTEAAELYPAGFDVVLSDWHMPEGGGARVIAESPAPVVISSTVPHEVARGAVAVVQKGDSAALKAALREALTKK